MRVALVILAMLLFAPQAMAGKIWEDKKVPVYDYSGWPEVPQTVAEFNAVLPKKAPSLAYQAKGVLDCSQVPQHKDAITVCSVPSVDGKWGHTRWASRGRYLQRSIISLSNEVGQHHRANNVCHEFMHAVTNIPDNYGALPDTSCVWGNLSAPGPFDSEYMRKVYKQSGKQGGKKRGR